MPVQHVRAEKIPPLIPVAIPSPLFMVGKEQSGELYFAIRNEAPVFTMVGDTPEEVYREANEIIDRFLSKMHRFGFRLAA